MSESETTPPLPRFGLTKTGVVAFVILGLGVAALAGFLVMKKEPPKAAAAKPPPAVKYVVAKIGDAPVTLRSQGLLESATETRAASEVPGKVVWVSLKFKAGGSFAAEEELLKLDDADFKAALAQAKAAAADARVAQEIEQARADQALRDWKKLEAGTKPDSELATRQPQLAAARAKVESADAAVAKAQRDLDRTTLRAPYAGRVRRKHTDIGSFVMAASPLADLYSTETFEVRLPLSVDEFPLLESAKLPLPVSLTARAGDRTLEFQAEIVRTEGEVDRLSRSIYVVAQIKTDGKAEPLLAPGLFLTATAQGRTMAGVARVPRVSVMADDRVWILDAKNRLHSQKVKVARAEEHDVLISEGLKEGDRVLATVLQIITEGMEVTPIDADKGEGADKKPAGAAPGADANGEKKEVTPVPAGKAEPVSSSADSGGDSRAGG